MAHNAVEARKHHNKRALESDEDLEMREPIKGGTAMSVALFISQLKEGLLKHDFFNNNRRIVRGARTAARHAQTAHDVYQSVHDSRELQDDDLLEREFDEEYFEREFDDLD